MSIDQPVVANKWMRTTTVDGNLLQYKSLKQWYIFFKTLFHIIHILPVLCSSCMWYLCDMAQMYESTLCSFYSRRLIHFTLPKSLWIILAPSSPQSPSPTPFFAQFFPPFLLYSRAPLTERLRQKHMSHRFTEIPIVLSQRAPQRSTGCPCVSQRGFVVCANANPTSFHTTPCTPCCTCTCMYGLPILYISISPYTLSTHGAAFYLHVTACHSVQTEPSTNRTIWLTRRPLTDLFHNLPCSGHCIGLLW